MATKPLHACTTENPRKMFESAIALVQKARSSARSSAPIVARRQAPAPAQREQADEKRALTDAARALAQLWKVSPHLVR